MGNNCCTFDGNGTNSRNKRALEEEVSHQCYSNMAINPVHTDAVVSLASIQPGLCLSGSKDKNVILYDYQNAREEDKWTGHDREITKVCYGSSCLGVFSASRDKSIKMWQRGNSHAVRDFVGHEMVVTAIHANRDTTKLCSGSRDNTVRIWDIETASCLLQNNIPQNLVTDVKWIANTEQIVQTGEDKEVSWCLGLGACLQLAEQVMNNMTVDNRHPIRIFDSRSMNVVHSFVKKQYIQMCCDVSDDGLYCLTCSNGFGGNGCEATLWDLRSRTLLQEYNGHHEAIEACIFLPNLDKPLIATASRDCSIKIWNRDTKECITEWCFGGSGPLTSIIAYDNNSILVGSFNQGIQVLQLVDDKLVPRSSY